MKTFNITLLSEVKTDKHIAQAKKIISQVGELFKCKINIKQEPSNIETKGSLQYFQEVIKSCQESEAAILCLAENDSNRDAALRNELGIISRYSNGQSCAVFEPVIKLDESEESDQKNVNAYINCMVLLFDYLKISDASILLRKGYDELIKGKENMNDYADSLINYIKDRLTSYKMKETENYGEVLMSWGGMGQA